MTEKNYPTIEDIRKKMQEDPTVVDPDVFAVAMCDCPRCMVISMLTNFSAYLENVLMPSLNMRDYADVGELFRIGMLNSQMMSMANEMVDEWNCFEWKELETDEDEIPF